MLTVTAARKTSGYWCGRPLLALSVGPV